MMPGVLRLDPLLFVCRIQCPAVPVDYKRHSLSESHVPERDCCSKRRQSIFGVREVRAIVEEVLKLVRVLAQEMPKALSAEPSLHYHSCDIVVKAFNQTGKR